ncbi:cyclic pyranopterin monophosphate synthase MoaC [Marinivivus vitaminiproducens]|uniref:cyclic pyranopterin monophosphate synthase MoaC n=1 Tax=Marinivivus vitaminiproducens TaxID=3035935 RepID=UPI00279DBA42|nr:cyclic pyranopterin monophosphate synthase MoaC [Geminicoccaceae bacterium SCSIO 64248]
MTGFSHFDEAGNAVMVDVGGKEVTERRAVARGRIAMAPGTLAMITAGAAAKGDVLGTARLAGIMAAKQTAALIPLCHPLPLTSVKVDLTPAASGDAVEIEAICKVTGRTGVEMEALTAVTVAALTVYDMCKAVDRAMRIEAVRLVRKEGGRSGVFEAPDAPAG